MSRKTKTSGIKITKEGKKPFSSGALRQVASGKGLPSLCSPISERKLAQHMEGGVEAGYSPRNWEKGLPLCSILDSLKRHIQDELEGKTDENHASAIEWNAHIYNHTKEMIRRGLLPKELDDLPNYIPKTCPLHPKRKLNRKPQSKCDLCWLVWDNRRKK